MKNHKLIRRRLGNCRLQQSGISLVIVMIFLVILSGLAIIVMQGSTFSSRIAANEADRTLAFQAAEAALRDAENDINGNKFDGATPCSTTPATCRAEMISWGDGFDTTCDLGRCIPNATLPNWEDSTMWDTTSVKSVVYGTYTGATALPVVNRQPRYILEYFKQGDYAVYRVTAVGFGANDSTRAMLQSAVKAKPL